MHKVSIIGAGNVGATAVYYIAEKNLADIVMVDVVEGLPQAKAMDYLHASPMRQYSVHISGTNDYKGIADSDVVILCAGIPRKPGMDRMDLMKVNVEIAKKASQAIAEHAPNAIVIVVSNPLDIIAMTVLQESGFALKRVMGMAGVLDATRFRYFIAENLGVWPGDVMAMVLGGHGDSMVPMARYTRVAGIPVDELIDPGTLEALIVRTRTGGGEIVSLLKQGSAFYAPGASVANMVEAIVKDEKRVTPVSAYLRGEYGYQDIFLGVPVLLGKNGIEKIIELDLSPEEKTALDESAAAVKDGVDTLRSFYAPG
ncbi:MAG: malate dehydrogenase [Desulfobacteraceae bacterium]|nr:malate dehydrogenase [Desulfobacteraceae bacterium]